MSLSSKMQMRAPVSGARPSPVVFKVNSFNVNSSVRTTAPARRVLSVKASATPPTKSGFAKYADSIGLPTDEGFFGFKPFGEMWCGRLAMMGFVISIVEECATGKGTLGQIGLPMIANEPNQTLLIALLALTGTGVLAGTISTANKVFKKKMTVVEINRYRNFLGLIREERAAAEALAMKQRSDGLYSTTKPYMEASATSTAEASTSESMDATPEPAAPSTSAAAKAKAQSIEDIMYGSGGSGMDEMQYAKDVEVSNGRAAMIGFLLAVLVEAGTGKGIVLQLIMYCKMSGLLGPMSGF